MNKNPGQLPDLPANFRFCVSTAAHQVEGYNYHSDWWHFEQVAGNIKSGHTSEHATDSWNHVDEDIQNLKFLCVDTYRFSIEWAKIEPRAGDFKDDEIARYSDLITKLKTAKLEAMVTLYHFTLPQWVAEQGGWEWPGIVEAFNTFVQRVARKLEGQVSHWITLNEPMTIIAAGYLSNVFPPAKNDIKSIGLPMANMIRAHALAYHSLHAILGTANVKPKVGLAHHLRIFDPARRFHPLDQYLARKFDEIFNWSIPNALQTGHFKFNLPGTVSADYGIPEAVETQDFFGLNYYSRDRIRLNIMGQPKFLRQLTPNVSVTELDWEIYPQGLDRLIRTIHSRYPHLPIWITENGLADKSDQMRIPFIRSHLEIVAKHIKKGVDIQGYCHWTLNDNFEWAEGYTAHFGFYEIEKGTLNRIPRPSAKLFSELVKAVKRRSR